MEHSAYREILSALLDGELHGAEREAALAHLDGCADCRAYFEELAALHAALGDMEEFDAPGGFAAGVMARLRAENEATRLRAGGTIAMPHAEGTPKAPKKHVAQRGYAALAACAAVVLLAVYALPNALRMGGNSVARDSAVQAAPAEASPAGASGAPSAPAEAPQMSAAPDPSSDYNYFYAGGGDPGMMPESARAEEGGAEDVRMPSADNDGAANRVSNGTADALLDSTAADERYATTAVDDTLSAANEEETGADKAPFVPLSRPAGYDEDVPILTLSGEGAEDWLAEHGWQGESGAWYADAAALRALPDGLTVLYSELPEDYDGVVYVELWEVEP